MHVIDYDAPGAGSIFAWPIAIVNGRAHRAAVPVVPQRLPYAPVTADTGPGPAWYDMNAAFMSYQQHELGNHAVRAGAPAALGIGSVRCLGL